MSLLDHGVVRPLRVWMAGLLAILAAVPAAVSAASFTWDGGTGTSQAWNEPANWNPDGVPLSASDTSIVFSGTFNTGTSGSPLNQNIASPFVLNSLSFTSGASVAHYLGGNQLQFVANGATQPVLSNYGQQNKYFANLIDVPASTTLNLVNDTWNVYLNGQISGAGTLSFNTRPGGGQWYLTTANSYGGGTIYNGTSATQRYCGVYVSASGGLGTGLVTLNGGNPTDTGSPPPAGLYFSGASTSYANNFFLQATSPLFVTGSGVTFSGAFNLSDKTLYLRGSGSGTISGSIGGTGAITKNDPGTWTLTGANTYSGGTSLSDGAGPLAVEVNTAKNGLGTGPVSIGAGSMLQINNLSAAGNDMTTIANTFTGTGLVKLNFAAGTPARNTYMNNITGFTGTVELTAVGASGDKWNASTNAPGATVKVNSGTQLFLGGACTFAGVQIIGTGNTENRGAIRLSNTLNAPVSLLGDATIGTEGGTINGAITSGAAGTQLLTIGAPSNNTGGATLNGAIGGGTGAIALNSVTRGDVVLGANNTYAGGTTIGAGRVRVSTATGFGTGSVTVASGAEAYLLSATYTNAFLIAGDGGNSSVDSQPRGALRIEGATIGTGGSVTLQGHASVGSYSGSTGTINAAIGESGGSWGLGINKSSAGVPGTIVLGGANTYTGGTTVYNGTLRLSGNNRLWTGGAITLLGGALDLGGNTQETSGAVSFQGGSAANGTIVKSGAPYDAQSGNIYATLAGTAGLTKTTAGTLVLAGAHNTYAGPTIISQGTLRLGPPSAPVPGALYWLDATAGVVESGGSVSQWNDQTANGRNFTQGTAANQPQYVPGGLNGLPVVRFDGADNPNNDRLVLGTSTSPQTIFIVNKPRFDTGYKGLAGIWGQSGADFGIRANSNTSWSHPGNTNDFSNTSGSVFYINGSVGSSFGGPTTPHVLSVVRGSAITWSATAIGDYWGNPSYQRQYAGDIAEVIAYGTALNAADRRAVEEYLLAKWLGLGVTTDILPTTTDVQLAAGATLDLNGVSQTIASLADYGGGGGGAVVNSASSKPLTLTINPASGSTAFSGTISDSGPAGGISLVKNGAGTQVLAGANTYSGGTTINAGTLLVNNTTGSGTGAGAVQVNAGTLGGSGSISGPVVVGDNLNAIDAYLAPGASPGILSTGSLTLNSDAALLAELRGPAPGTGYDQVHVTGSVVLNSPTLELDLLFAPDVGGQFVLIDNDADDSIVGAFAGLPEGSIWTGSFGESTYRFLVSYAGGDGNDFVLTSVPEPAAWFLAVIGIFGLRAAARRRNRPEIG